ncbi:hypothetical protein D3C81_1065620 [compost metagenome]
MQHQLLVRGLHDATDIQEQLQPLLQAQLMLHAPAVQRHAIDELHHQIRMTIRRGATVVQPCHLRQLQIRQHLPFRAKAFDFDRTGQAVQQLDRHRALVNTIGTLGLEHGAHAALCDALGQAPRPQPLADAKLRRKCMCKRGIQPIADAAQAHRLRTQQLPHFLAYRCVVTAFKQCRPPLLTRQLADGIKQIANLSPAFGAHGLAVLRVGQRSWRFSQARAKRRSRSTVGADTPSTKAISSRLMPPK